MSIPVDLSALADALANHTYAYLLTVSDDGRPHAVAVNAVLSDGVLRAGVGSRSTKNSLARPDAVSLVWPPKEDGGYSLIVDGHASVTDEMITVVPSKAVMHRAAPADAGPAEPGSCGSDCVPLMADSSQA